MTLKNDIEQFSHFQVQAEQGISIFQRQAKNSKYYTPNK